MKPQKLFGIFLVMLGIGCGASQIQQQKQSSNETRADLAPLILSQDFLVGNWTSGCHLDSKSNTYVDEYLQVDLEVMNRLSTYYLDPHCTNALYQQNLQSEYLFSAKGKYSEKRILVSITPFSSIAMGMFTSYQGLCGTRDWKLNEEKNFKAVEQCGFQKVVNSTLSARRAEGRTELMTRDCPASSSECFDSIFWRR